MTFVASHFELPDAGVNKYNPFRPGDRQPDLPVHLDRRSRKAVCVSDLNLYRREENY